MDANVETKEIRNMVRLMATDINGNILVINALRKIKGISFMFSHAICVSSGINPRAKIGSLNDAELKSIENEIKKQTSNATFPKWLLNRRNDIETGMNMHLIGTQIDLARREDINLMRRMRSYKGVRHQMGQPVRGQRTRSSFRTSKRAVGVMKKAARAAAKAKAPEKGEKK
jgi:small subunit ribosomal protein S13